MSTAIITGASSGLGRAYIDATIRELPDVREIWIIARNADKLQRIAAQYTNVRIVPVPLDLTDPHSYDELRDRLAEARPDIRLLVSNAGMGSSQAFADEDPHRLERLVQLNVTADTIVIRHCLPYMRRGSLLLQTGSILGVFPVRGLAAYSASKAYVRTLSIALRSELKTRGIYVTAVQPGLMDTPMLAHEENGTGSTEDAATDRKYRSRTESGIGAAQTPLPVLNPRDVAAGSLRAVKRNKATYQPHPFNKMLALLSKLLPASLLL